MKRLYPNMQVAVISEKGHRDENQDWMSWTETAWGELFIVADGMGGYKGGARASQMTVEGIERHVATLPSDWSFTEVLREAARRTNAEVYDEATSGNPETERMGSTLVAALVSGREVVVGHIGDSRAYLVRKGRLELLTKDHTVVQQMLDADMITAAEARNHPDASVLTRAVGSRPEVEIDIGDPITLENGDGLLLCSDGLSGFVDDREIRKTLRRVKTVQQVPEDLKELALKTGSDDNITVQFIRFGEVQAEGRRVTLPIPVMRPPDRVAVLTGAFSRLAQNRSALASALIVVILVAGASTYRDAESLWDVIRTRTEDSTAVATAETPQEDGIADGSSGAGPELAEGDLAPAAPPESVTARGDPGGSEPVVTEVGELGRTTAAPEATPDDAADEPDGLQGAGADQTGTADVDVAADAGGGSDEPTEEPEEAQPPDPQLPPVENEPFLWSGTGLSPLRRAALQPREGEDSTVYDVEPSGGDTVEVPSAPTFRWRTESVSPAEMFRLYPHGISGSLNSNEFILPASDPVPVDEGGLVYEIRFDGLESGSYCLWEGRSEEQAFCFEVGS